MKDCSLMSHLTTSSRVKSSNVIYSMWQVQVDQYQRSQGVGGWWGVGGGGGWGVGGGGGWGGGGVGGGGWVGGGGVKSRMDALGISCLAATKMHKFVDRKQYNYRITYGCLGQKQRNYVHKYHRAPKAHPYWLGWNLTFYVLNFSEWT